MKKLLLTVLTILLFLLVSSITAPKVSAQVCGGQYTCSEQTTTCACSNDGSPCNAQGDACGGLAGTCSCVDLNNNIVADCAPLNQQYCLNPAGECLNGQLIGISGCSWTPAASTCDSSNCFNRSCTSNGQSCSCYGVCSGGSCTTGGAVPGTCSGGSTPTPTLTPCPGQCSTSSGPGGNYTYNGTYDAYCAAQPNGNANAYCWVSSGSTPTPTSTPCPGQCSTASGPGGNYTYNGTYDAYCAAQPNGNANAYCWVSGGGGCTPGNLSCSGSQICTCSAGGVNNCVACGGISVCTTTNGAPQCTTQICSPNTSAYVCGGTSC